MNSFEEIISILQEEIKSHDTRTKRSETGVMLEIGDGIIPYKLRTAGS